MEEDKQEDHPPASSKEVTISANKKTFVCHTCKEVFSYRDKQRVAQHLLTKKHMDAGRFTRIEDRFAHLEQELSQHRRITERRD
jgi:transposase-like protein